MFKKIIALLIMVSFFYFVGATGVLASNNISVQVKTYLNNGQKNVPGVAQTGKSRGDKVSFSHPGGEYDFAFFAVNGSIREDLPSTHEFTVQSRMEITAIYHRNGSSSTLEHAVVFVDSNRQIIDVKYVTDGSTVTEPSELQLPTPPPFMQWAGTKWLTKGASSTSSLENITSSRVYHLQYTPVAELTTYALNVSLGLGSGNYAYNSVVTVTPTPQPGKAFSHWADAEGNKLSYKSTYKFSILGVTSIQAVFVDGETSPAEQPVVSMSENLGIKGEDFVTYKGQMQLPAGYSIVEYGFIFSRSSDVLTLTSLGATIVPSNIHYGVTGEFMRSFQADTFNSIRAYMIIQNGSNPEEVVYSDNYYRSISQIGEAGSYHASFDSASKVSYATGSVDVSGVNWTLDDSLIGTDPNKIGAKSVRLRNAMWTNSGFSNITSIAFKAALWSADDVNTLIISLSNDGTTWVDVTDGLNQTEVSSLTLVDYTFTLSNSNDFVNSTLSLNEPLRVKIEVNIKGQRINIDEVTINYGPHTGAIHEVELVTSVSTTNFYADGTIFTSPSPSTGYSFDAWYLDSNFQTPYSNTGVKQSLTLYANFVKQTYTITFNYNGADAGNTVESMQVEYQEIIDLPTPTKTGYDFAGWESSTGTTQYPSPYTVEASNRNMYAKWVINDTGRVALDKQLLSLPLSISTDDPLELITDGANGTTISWSSNNTNVISTSGIVSLPQDEPVEVTLIATIELNGVTDESTFIIVVNPATNNVPVVLRQSDFGTTNLNNGTYDAVKTTPILNGSEDPNPTGSSSWDTKGSNFNNTGWDFVRMGGKTVSTLDNPNAYIRTNYILSGTITSIVINIVGLDSASGSETLHMQTSSDNITWTTVTFQTISSTGNLTFSGLNYSNLYYRFVFVRASTSSNVGTDIKSITFYGNP